MLLLGDSITERCFSISEGRYADSEKTFIMGSALSDLFCRRMDIVYRGFSGYTSEQGRFMVDDILASLKDVKLATVFFGSNDASETPFLSVPLERYTENITYIVSALQKAGVKVIVVGPALHDEAHPNSMFKDLPPKFPLTTLRNLEYSNAAAGVAKKCGVPFVDLWHAFLASVGWQEGDPIPGDVGSNSPLSISHLLNDGLHFTGAGYRVLYDEIVKVIETHYPEFIPDQMPYLFPDFRSFVDPTEAENIFKTRRVPKDYLKL